MTNLTLKSLYSVRYYLLAMFTLAVFTAALVIPQVIKAQTPSTIPLCEITRGLRAGTSGQDVLCLQRYLNWAGYTISASGPGSPGNESMYFGSLTTNAVMKWQNANASQVLAPAGLTSGTGYFGPLSFNWYVSIVRTQLGLPQ